ncbi:hypothetical protein KDA_59990 [Dictyobacter alpinus]|uniref:DUF11 domain-containing protein n=2 Tax=Dictyobacter alpinus TaxID=2014873 RepID=A0A402BGK9_9CHLR|nr:hypothetical protein KDA_59990 [Dictyobacter alpinus]
MHQNTNKSSNDDKHSADDYVFQVGDTVTYTLIVTNAETAGPVVAPNQVTVSDIIPLGEKNLQASGSGWTFTISSTTSPAVITATFVGPYPVRAGESLPPITITAILTSDAVPAITDTATVATPGNRGVNSTATDTVFVEAQQNQQHEEIDHNKTVKSSNDVSNNNNNNNDDRNHTEYNNEGNTPTTHRTHSHRNGTPGLPLTGSDPASH